LHWAVATNQHEIVSLLIQDMQPYHALRLQEQQSKAKLAVKQRGSLKVTDTKNDSDFDDESPYAKMLDLPNVCGHTPFFVAIIKGHLKIA
jgi:hypothetical protein